MYFKYFYVVKVKTCIAFFVKDGKIDSIKWKEQGMKNLFKKQVSENKETNRIHVMIEDPDLQIVLYYFN